MPAQAEGDLLPVRVQPRASRNEVVGWQAGALRVRVTAAPTAGEANRAVVALLAEALAVPPSAVELVRGASGREKLFRVQRLTLETLTSRLGKPEPARRPPVGVARSRGLGGGALA